MNKNKYLYLLLFFIFQYSYSQNQIQENSENKDKRKAWQTKETKICFDSTVFNKALYYFYCLKYIDSEAINFFYKKIITTDTFFANKHIITMPSRYIFQSVDSRLAPEIQTFLEKRKKYGYEYETIFLTVIDNKTQNEWDGIFVFKNNFV